MEIGMREANDILEESYPEPGLLKKFPYGDLLLRLWEREDDIGKEYRSHGPIVLKAMNILLGNKPEDILGARHRAGHHLPLRATQNEIFGCFRDDENEIFMSLFRLAALYHDIGKYIIKERHPTIGWYMMEYLRPNEKEGLLTLLDNREDYLELLMTMIRDHDEFGVLSTGEASYPILMNAATSLGNSPDDQKKTISAIFWLNLSDMAGTPGLNLSEDDLEKTIFDLNWYLSALKTCGEKKSNLEDYVVETSSDQEMVIQRISRLVLESCRKYPNLYAQLAKKDRGELQIAQRVRNQLRRVYPTQNPRREFCIQFTHVCKLDYGLRFFRSLVEYCMGVDALSDKPFLPFHAQTGAVDIDKLIYSVLAILRRLTQTYLSMIRTGNEVGNLIGVEMKDLVPQNAPEKTAQICRLLVDTHYPGLSWIMSDCPAWYF